MKDKLHSYVRGKLSASERMDIAKVIKENLVLADAVEGLHLSLNREKKILELEQSVRNKYQNSCRGEVISFQSKATLAATASVLIFNKFRDL